MNALAALAVLVLTRIDRVTVRPRRSVYSVPNCKTLMSDEIVPDPKVNVHAAHAPSPPSALAVSRLMLSVSVPCLEFCQRSAVHAAPVANGPLPRCQISKPPLVGRLAR